jgi:uncharacterized protein involved in exopolysaccharide biosynthesis
MKDKMEEKQIEQEDDEINLLDYVKVILKHKRLIIWIVGVTVVLTAAISLIMTPIYRSAAVILPIASQGERLGASSIAAQFGFAVPEQPNKSEIVGLLNSNILRERVLKKYKLLPVLLGENSIQGKTEGEKLWMGLRYLEGTLKVNPKQKEGTIEVSMGFKDPKVASDIVNHMLGEITDYMSSETRRVAETNQKYLELQIDKTADPFIKTKIYALIAQQIETSAMAEAKENFAFKIIDPPKVPDKRIKPKRRQMVIIAFVVSLFLGIFAAFGKEYFDKQKKGRDWQEIKELCECGVFGSIIGKIRRSRKY